MDAIHGSVPAGARWSWRDLSSRLTTNDRLAALCSSLYLFVTVPTLILLCVVIAPFHGSDEVAHFLRATCISQGAIQPLVGRSQTPGSSETRSAGGFVDAGIVALVALSPVPLLRDPHHKIGREELAAQLAIPSQGHSVYRQHSNTAIYPPMLYAAPAAAALAGRVLGWPTLWSLYAGRLLGALVGAAILYSSIRRAGAASVLLLVAATLPITLFQMATLGTDALLLPLASAFAVLILRLLRGQRVSRRETLALATVTFLIAVGKIAYLPLTILPVAAALYVDRGWTPRVRQLLAGAVVTIILWAGWAMMVGDKVFTIREHFHIDVLDQLLFAVANPWRTLQIIGSAMSAQFENMAVQAMGARLGWYEFAFPHWYILLCLAAVGLASLVAARPVRWSWPPLLAVTAVALSCYVVTYLLIYAQNNPVGGTAVAGVQGRYFTPLLVIILCLTPRLRLAPVQVAGVAVAVAGWCAFGSGMMIYQSVMRYWI